MENVQIKKFLLFAGDNFYPAGGFYDLVDSFESREEFDEKYLIVPKDLKKPLCLHTYDWSHLMNLETGQEENLGEIILKEKVPELLDEHEKQEYKRKMKELKETGKKIVSHLSGC